MERLGSKSAAPIRDKEVKDKTTSAPVPVSERPLARAAKSDPNGDVVVPVHAPPDPAPLYEGFFTDFPPVQSLLDAQKPLFSPASFAIIVQADCCTPATPDLFEAPVPPLEEAEFEIETDAISVRALETKVALPLPAGVDHFGEPWLFMPEVSQEGLWAANQNLPAEHEQALLEFDALLEGEEGTEYGPPLGSRPQIPVRPRFRYPYAASQISSMQPSSVQREIDAEGPPLVWTQAEDWDAIIPSTDATPPVHPPLPPEKQPDPLSIAALLLATNASSPDQWVKHVLGSGEEVILLQPEDLTIRDVPHEIGRGACLESAESPLFLERPRSATVWQPTHGWRGYQAPKRVNPVPFPSLFQTGSVLPPRPEVPVQ
jgi:hypothetical protein